MPAGRGRRRHSGWGWERGLFLGAFQEDKQRQYVEGPVSLMVLKIRVKASGAGAGAPQRASTWAAGGWLVMGPHGGQLGVDSGFVPSAVGLDKLPYFQNSLGRGRSLEGWAVSLRRRRRLLGKGSTCHILSLESHLCVPASTA